MTGFCGIIAQFDPFHYGHAHLLESARFVTGCSHVAVAMSACFTQRGAPALLPPRERAMMALMHGADVVAALPAVWSLRDAEHFALGGVASLDLLGCDRIIFGSECGDIALLTKVAEAMEDPSPMLLAAIHSRLDAGLGYPAALDAAIKLMMPEAQGLLSSPNDTLGICYIRAIYRLGLDIVPYCIKRQGAFHDANVYAGFSSATAVRGAILRGDWQGASQSMPEDCWPILQKAVSDGRIHRADALEQSILYRLRTMQRDDLHELPGISQGIEDRLMHAAQRASTMKELLDLCVTKRYTAARIRRLCCHALLQINEQAVEDTPLPKSIQILGFRRDSGIMPLLKTTSAPTAVRAAELPLDTVEDRARDLWALGAGMPSGMRYTEACAVL